MGVWSETSYRQAYTVATTCWPISDTGLIDTDVMSMYTKEGTNKI